MTTMIFRQHDEPAPLLVPIRLDVFGIRTVMRKRKLTPVGCGWQGWNPDARMEGQMARLAGSGSFYWQGAISALCAAKRMMREDQTIQQIKLETISGREIGRLYRRDYVKD